MAALPSALIEALQETNAKLLSGRDALLSGQVDDIQRSSQETEALAQRVAFFLSKGPMASKAAPHPEISRLLNEMRRLGRANTIIAGEMLRHFRDGLATLRRLESDRLYGPDGGEEAMPARRALGIA